MYNSNPAWRDAFPGETPGQLEPQLGVREVVTHVIDLDTNTTFCGGGVYGDMAITLDSARNPENDMYFDCESCYKIISGEVTDEHEAE